MPYMGVGRNLSYKRSLFFRHKGFASHLHLRSGDDDLFVNRAASKENTRIVYQKQAQTLSEPESAWGDYLRSEEHTSELQSLMRISYAVFCLKKKKQERPLKPYTDTTHHTLND